MTVEWTYWLYAAIQSLLLQVCAISCVVFAVWSWETRRLRPRPELWPILPLSIFTHAAIAVLAVRWIYPRAIDASFSVRMLQIVTESQSYTAYAMTQAALLTAVASKMVLVWRVRGWSRPGLTLLLAAMLAAAVGATEAHRRAIGAFCQREPAVCAAPTWEAPG
ncbi:hypothetical protein GCM10008171_33200 [Methylopila jiangsuensis]|uniref:Uncharacterized protein n=1 Tax=Methylopila jiangsuensis TaxID=586230 RepID=A0A9W6JKI0_9HYPH|nr:hypothetical protein [Methylopila jiangsuensis]MDR6284546.1 hypothetical protein [Methylopila jiangsuensis]GLK78066.1 hypothetical protein GCM10008171_33200 [Methylopila jiangsuensis]